MGFSEIAGTSLVDDENSNSFQGSGGGLVIPKSIFGGEKASNDVPSPGDASSFALQNAITNAILREPSKSPENRKTKYQFLPEEPMISERPETNTNQGQLSDLISTAVALKCGSDFPVATQESLELLEEMKQRLSQSKENECSSMFEMDVEEGGNTVIPEVIVEPPVSKRIEKPPGKIMSKLMQSGFAQNWFFKNDEPETDEESASASSSRKTSKEESSVNSMVLDDNASFQTFGPQTQDFAPRDLEGSGPKGFFGVLEDEKHKRSKRQFREVNFIAPQNL